MAYAALLAAERVGILLNEYLKRSWAEIELGALEWNLGQIRARLHEGCRVMGVVKADAYGHGACYVAKKLAACGVEWFGVSNLEEALELRRAGLAQPMLIFGVTPEEHAGVLAREGITQAVYADDYARALSAEAVRQGVAVDVHMKLDTGMTRLGYLCDDACFERSTDEVCAAAALPNLRARGVFTHFAASDEYENDSPAFTRMQLDRFSRMVDALARRGVHFELRHCCNSAGVMSYPEAHFEMVRPGNLLYGMVPSPECAGVMELRPVMTLRSVVASVKHVGAGAQVSYGRTHTLQRDADVAVVPIGYADGYRRALSRRARMLVNGHYAPVIGTVCMDQLMLDVSNVPGVKRGDPVVVIGAQGGQCVSTEELAGLLGTINYEITCQLTKRLPRVYLENGHEVGVECYNSPTLL